MSSFTPGPWFVVKRHPRSFARAITLSPDDARGDIANVISGLGSKDVEADAALIAAAPALLAALQMLADWSDKNVADPALTGPLGYARAAIAKATGEQP